jgi:hypothetical protein
MPVRQLRPCPLCGGPALRWPLAEEEEYNKILCPRCGTFIVALTLPAQPWARLDAEEMALVVFLPAYIRHRNRRNHLPLLTLKNWRALARRGRIVALRRSRPATVPEKPAAHIVRNGERRQRALPSPARAQECS